MISKNIARAGAGIVFGLLLGLAGQSVGAKDQSAGPLPSQPEANQQVERGFRNHRRFDAAKRAERTNAWNQVSATLSSEQQQQIDGIKQDTRNSVSPLRDRLVAVEADLKADPTGDDAAQRKAELRSLHQQIRAQFSAGRQKMLAVLTDTQRAELKAAFRNIQNGKAATVTQ